MSVVINTTQKTQKYLELKGIPGLTTYVQFGKAKKNKKKKRVIVNPLQGLRNTRNKYQQHILLQEANIKKPRFLRNYKEAIGFMRETGNPIVAKRVNHSRGRGMYLIKNEEELFACNPIVLDDSRYFFEEFVICNREWRIHVSRYHDEEVVAYRKCLLGEVVEEVKKKDLKKPWIRNLDTCYFKLDSEKDKMSWFGDMVAECKRAIEVLGMDIAGVDVGENNKVDGGEFYIYEVNSAPGMEDHTRSCYEKAIQEIIEIKAHEKGLI